MEKVLCPKCKNELSTSFESFHCAKCGQEFPYLESSKKFKIQKLTNTYKKFCTRYRFSCFIQALVYLSLLGVIAAIIFLPIITPSLSVDGSYSNYYFYEKLIIPNLDFAFDGLVEMINGGFSSMNLSVLYVLASFLFSICLGIYVLVFVFSFFRAVIRMIFPKKRYTVFFDDAINSRMNWSYDIPMFLFAIVLCALITFFHLNLIVGDIMQMPDYLEYLNLPRLYIIGGGLGFFILLYIIFLSGSLINKSKIKKSGVSLD